MLNTIFKDDLFAGKNALITGGGTGIGLRTARELAQLGARVVLAGRGMERLQEAAATIKQAGGQVLALECNIRDEEQVRDCVRQACEFGEGRIDYLVNNAGGQFPSPAEDISAKGWKAVIETNLTGTFYMTQQVFNQSMKKHGGAVVNVIANIWKGFPYMAHTGAARAGVDNLTKTLATEWGRYGFRINSVAPGVIASSGLNNYGPEFRPIVDAASKFNQTWRLGTEAETSAGILFLLSPAAAFITGETLKIDGGDWLYSPWMPPVENQNTPPFE